jgi:hypothetical protein
VARITTSPADTDTPGTMARVTGAELLRLLRAEADRVADIAARLRGAVATVTDPTAAEAEAVRAAAEQRAAAAEARATAAEQRAAKADQWRGEADAAAEEMAAQLVDAQARAAAEASRDAAIGQARGQADHRVSAAEAARLAQQEATHARAAEQAALAETGRVRADADKMLADFRADTARDRDDLRARSERARTPGRRLPRRTHPAPRGDRSRHGRRRRRDVTARPAGHAAVTAPHAALRPHVPQRPPARRARPTMTRRRSDHVFATTAAFMRSNSSRVSSPLSSIAPSSPSWSTTDAADPSSMLALIPPVAGG